MDSHVLTGLFRKQLPVLKAAIADDHVVAALPPAVLAVTKSPLFVTVSFQMLEDRIAWIRDLGSSGAILAREAAIEPLVAMLQVGVDWVF